MNWHTRRYTAEHHDHERDLRKHEPRPSDPPSKANPFADAPLLSLDEQIEAVEAKLISLIQKAETGEHWAEICRIEAQDLVPLLKLKVNQRIRDLRTKAGRAA